MFFIERYLCHGVPLMTKVSDSIDFRHDSRHTPAKNKRKEHKLENMRQWNKSFKGKHHN